MSNDRLDTDRHYCDAIFESRALEDAVPLLLRFAREYGMLGDQERADVYLKAVEREVREQCNG